MTQNSNKFSYLIDVYKLAKKNEKDFIDTQSAHWDKYNINNDKFLNLDNLLNFRKEQFLSDGLDDARHLQKKTGLLKVLENFDGPFLKQNLPTKNIGNCNYSNNFLGYWFDYGIIHHLKWYEKIQDYIEDNFYILEIGGGFGSLSRLILNNHNVKYFLVDLPEANLMSNYYLQSHFPEKKIFNYSDYKKSKLKDNIDNFDIFILPPRILDKEDINYDFVINTHSFQEMNKKTIKEYFDFIQKKIKSDGYFLSNNRYVKDTVGEVIRFDEYPYDDFWSVEISERSFLQPSMHFCLTKRKSEIGNIKDLLLDLKKSIHVKKNEFLKTRLVIHRIKRSIYLFCKFILNLFFSKKKIEKLSDIIRNMGTKN